MGRASGALLWHSKRAQPTAERLANEILGPGTFKQIQDTA